MNKSLLLAGLVLACVCILQTAADPVPKPEPEPSKVYRPVELRQAEDDTPADNAEEAAADVPSKGDTSSGRLFMKKFLLFKNMWGNNGNQQPVIIVTGNNGGTGTTTGTTSPTTTITSTGTVPTATGTITTTPITRGAPDDSDDDGDDEDDIVVEDAPAAVDVQALQAALAANAQEYVVTDQEIKGTSDSKATKGQESINLRRKGEKRGQVITVRIPPQYRRYFKNGQKVMLNTSGKRQTNRRVVKKRVNKNRRRVNKNKKNKNKRTRIVPVA